MSNRKILTYTMILAAIATPALAELTQIWVDVPPPAAQTETVPAARSGYAWAPGYYSWQNGTHVWTPGHWIEARANSHWESDHWEQADGRWHFVPGHWETN